MDERQKFAAAFDALLTSPASKLGENRKKFVDFTLKTLRVSLNLPPALQECKSQY